MFTELPRGSDRVIGQAIEIGATSNQALFPMARRDVARALSSPRTANLPDSFSAVNNGAVRPWRSARTANDGRCSNSFLFQLRQTHRLWLLRNTLLPPNAVACLPVDR